MRCALIAVAVALAFPESAGADEFTWNSTATTMTGELGRHRGAALSYEQKSQFVGSSYFKLQVTVQWTRSSNASTEQVVFFEACAGSVEVERRGRAVVVTSRCGKYDDLEEVTTWKFAGARDRLSMSKTYVTSPYARAARVVQRYLDRGELGLAAAMLQRITMSSSGHDDLTSYWTLQFLEAARAAGQRALARGDRRGAALGIELVLRLFPVNSTELHELLDVDNRRLPCCRADGPRVEFGARRARNAWVLNEAAAMLLRGGGDLYVSLSLLRGLADEVPDRAATQLDLGDALWKLADQADAANAGAGDDHREAARGHYQRYVELRRKTGKSPAARAEQRSAGTAR